MTLFLLLYLMCIQTIHEQLIAASRMVIKLYLKLYLREFVTFSFYLSVNVSRAWPVGNWSKQMLKKGICKR